MPTDDRAVLIDSNVLIFASTPASPFHAAALSAIERIDEAGTPVWISAQIVREYLVHMTRSDVLGARTVADVVDQTERLCRHYRVADDSDAVRTELLNLVRRFGVQGKTIHDANIVATCLALGIPRLLTHNAADFARFAPFIELDALG